VIVLPQLLAETTEAHLQALLSAKHREDRLIEYKSKWPNKEDARETGELTADFSSFANTLGGDIIYGIRAKDGVPTDLVGLQGFVLDDEKLKAEQLLARWVKPRVLGLEFHEVPLSSGGVALVVRIPRSALGLHMVMFEERNKIYGRHSGGRYAMEIEEITRIILAKETRDQKIDEFRLNRIRILVSGKAEVPLVSSYATVVHLLPLNELVGYSAATLLVPLSTKVPMLGQIYSKGDAVMRDSCMIRATDNNGATYSYVQIFRDGTIEAVQCSPGSQNSKNISPGYEKTVRDWLFDIVPVLRALGVDIPLRVGVAHVGVVGFTMYESPAKSFSYLREQRIFDQPAMVNRPDLLDRFDHESVDRIVKSQFDQVWNTFGRTGSPNFDPGGKWKG
jgi:hypothetical protein